MNGQQFKDLKPGDVIYGFHKGSHFAARIVEISDKNRTVVQYASGATSAWSRSHIEKYYSIFPMNNRLP